MTQQTVFHILTLESYIVKCNVFNKQYNILQNKFLLQNKDQKVIHLEHIVI